VPTCATVQYPLRRIYGAGVRVGPLSVLADPLRALRVTGLEAGSPFSEKILYVYRKQLEEADIILINKCDILAPDRVDRLQHAVEERYRGSQVLRVSAREGSGLDRWFAALDAETGSQAPPESITTSTPRARRCWAGCTRTYRWPPANRSMGTAS
jgi:G3E family GTPase